MSVDINWEALTGGPDGRALADTIRDFVHERFQAIELPKLIRSVSVHSFEFGNTAPEVVLKDIGNPLPDFYETDGDDTSANDEAPSPDRRTPGHAELRHPKHLRTADGSRRQSELDILEPVGSPAWTRGLAPGMLGTTTNLGYFHLPLSAGLPGTQTPLAAVAGAHFASGVQPAHEPQRQSDSFRSASPATPATPASSRSQTYADQAPNVASLPDASLPSAPHAQDYIESSPDDLQVIFHVTYAGDFKLSLTADVFLDYPMPSFVGIPLKLKITGLTFNGVGILAYIGKRAHLCFLNPVDAEALVGGDPGLEPLDPDSAEPPVETAPKHVGGLLEDIRIESEMGETESGKQVLKNVGKIEKFILEQVQRIFEDEFVYPSFWTFLV